jgi:hypothetical protein
VRISRAEVADFMLNQVASNTVPSSGDGRMLVGQAAPLPPNTALHPTPRD